MFRILLPLLALPVLAAQSLPYRHVALRQQTADSVTVVVSWSASNADSVRIQWPGVTRTRGPRGSESVRLARPSVATNFSLTLTPLRGSTAGTPRPLSLALPVRPQPAPTIDSAAVDTMRAGASAAPSALPLLWDVHHDVAVPLGFIGMATRSSPLPQVVADPSDPTGDGRVLRQFWGGVGDGQSPSFLLVNTPVSHLIVTSVVRFGAGIVPPNEVKWLTWAPTAGFAWLGIYGSEGVYGGERFGLLPGQSELRFVRRGRVDAISSRVGAVVPVPVGRWTTITVELRLSPSLVRVWVDGVLTQESGSEFDWQGIASLGELQFGSTWGGGNGRSAPSGLTVDYARTTAWGR